MINQTRRNTGTAVIALGFAMALGSGSTAFAQKPVNIEFVAGIVGIPFYTSMECGARDAAKALGVNLHWEGPPQWDLALQMPILQAAIERDPNGLVLAPTDPNALITIVDDLVNKKHIPVVTVDGSLSKPVDLQNIRTDNIAAGGLAADAMAKAIGDKGTVLVVGLDPGVVANQERVDGFTKEIKAKYPDINVLPTEYPGSDQNKAAELVSAALQAHPDLKGVYTTHSNAAVGASSAIVGAGLQGKVKLIAYDADPGEVRDLKAGIYDALVVQSPYLEGYDSVTLVTKILRGEVNPATLPHEAHPPMVVATRDNIDTPAVKKNLYVDSCSN